MSSEDNDIIELNAGGTEFTTTRATLCYVKDSTLTAKFSGRWQNDKVASGKIFLDYNPILFAEIIKYFEQRINAEQCLYQNQITFSERESHVPSPTFESVADTEEFETLCDFLGIQQVILPPIKDDDFNVVQFAKRKEFDIRDVNKRIYNGPNRGMTWLIVAAKKSHKGNLVVLKYLLQHEADVNAVDECNRTALWWASCEDYVERVKALIAFRADVNNCDTNGCTPTHIAAGKGHVNCLKVLIASSADVNACDRDFKTPTYITAQKGHVECLKTLIASSADVNKCDVNGCTPTYITAGTGDVECLKALIDSSGDVNKCDADFRTPTFIAALHGHVECLKTLIASSADVNKCYINGYTPTFAAVICGKANCIQLLFDANANILTPAKNGKTPLDFAKEMKKDSCVQLLTKLMNNNK